MASWYVYVARCADGTLYCGIALDVHERIAAHDAGTGAKYTAGRGPLVVLLTRRCGTKGLALRLEYAIKQLSRRAKEQLVTDPARVTAIVRRLRRVTSARANASSPREPARQI
ncbi:MAG TPA: GIY-YIG nuclease family protein [Kofleriaceae bacterium]|nr:GIY-YIG nuclease family protein [Kofleriaceae bacterium]